MWKQTLSTLLFVSLTTAHFILLWPPNAGFDEDKEPEYPCGGFVPVINSSTPAVQVDRFAVSIQNVHPVGQWAFRGTTDTKAPYNFTDLVPLVNTTGIGDFCLDYLKVPNGWAGKSGVIQMIDNSPDGVLHQCAPVKFVSGSNNTIGSHCSNSSSLQSAEWTTEQQFKGELEGATDSSGSTPTGSTASSSSSGVAAMVTGVSSIVGGVVLLAGGLVL